MRADTARSAPALPATGAPPIAGAAPTTAAAPIAAGPTAAGPTVEESLRAATAALTSCSSSARLDAEVLLAHALGTNRAALIVRAGEPLAAAAARAYRDLIARRGAGTPVAYLTGVREFWSMPLAVTADVLVPRPETELLVEAALERLPRAGHARVLDLGTGGGAVALALARERPLARIVGIDICEAALRVARANAAALGLDTIEWRAGSWFAAAGGERFDVIVSNPPYLAAADPALGALRCEPTLALIAGPTGLEMLDSIVAGAPTHLAPGGWLLVEHGAGQAGAVAALFRRGGFADIGLHRDLSGRPRLTRGRLAAPVPPTSPSHHQEPS